MSDINNGEITVGYEGTLQYLCNFPVDLEVF